jgi:hypothetical protein
MTQNDPEKPLTGKQEQAALLVVKDELTDEQISAKLKIGRKTLQRWKNIPAFVSRLDELRAKIREAITAQGIAHKQNRIDSLADLHRRMQMVIDARAQQHADVPGGESGVLVRQVRFAKVFESGERVGRRGKTSRSFEVGDRVEVLDEGLAKLRAIVPGAPPNHHGVVEEIWSDGNLLIIFDDTEQSAPYPPNLVRLRSEAEGETMYPSKQVVEIEEYAVDTGLLSEMRATKKQIAQELGEWEEKHSHTINPRQALAELLGVNPSELPPTKKDAQ